MGCSGSKGAASGTENPVAADGNDGLFTEVAKDEAEATLGDAIERGEEIPAAQCTSRKAQ